MNKLFKSLSLLAVIAFFAAACIPPVVDVARAAPAQPSYQTTLGKSVRDKTVSDFIASNSCTQAGAFQLCQPAGLALWTDENRIVKAAYLYLENSEGFAPYKGVLPLGLVQNDTMADVEQKMGQPRVPHAPQAGWEPGLPDYGNSPDRMHYWAVYKRFGMTVIYNSPSANDKNATIHTIIVNK
ncbi:MAG TPA: hypothetical protein VK897_16400 [Anaerolineales bacterium]|nr:hypothetical protein [Anaerolineales bacterium]